MCVSHKMTCECGSSSAELTMRDEVLGPEVVKGLYCPVCALEDGIDPGGMLSDNGWVIVFDMEIVKFKSSAMTTAPREITPEFVFDEGYCTWAGYCPGDIASAAEERAEIVKLMKSDPRAYVKALTDWGKNRAARLAAQGWRKARMAC